MHCSHMFEIKLITNKTIKIMEENLSILTGMIAVICIFGLPVILGAFVLVKLITSNNKERLELARHGIVMPVRAKPSPNKYRSLRNGILCIGTAIGLAVGVYIASYMANVSMEGDISPMYIEKSFYFSGMKFFAICASTIFCLGLSYIVFYFIVKDKNMENEEA